MDIVIHQIASNLLLHGCCENRHDPWNGTNFDGTHSKQFGVLELALMREDLSYRSCFH